MYLTAELGTVREFDHGGERIRGVVVSVSFTSWVANQFVELYDYVSRDYTLTVQSEHSAYALRYNNDTLTDITEIVL